jgi:NTP pyrophosphatase (non-canonical NTP hydrolase)
MEERSDKTRRKAGEPGAISDREATTYYLRQLVQDFIDERDWAKYHNPKDLAISIAIEAAELMELFQWMGEKEAETVPDKPESFGRLEEELADIIILCLSLANVSSVDVARAVAGKLEKNRDRYPVRLVKGNYRKYTELRGESAD